MNHIVRNYKILYIIIVIITFDSYAKPKVLEAHFRHRPPEMIVNNKETSGPLKDILEEAARSIGYTVRWEIVPFARSLEYLKSGKVDIVPRTIKNKKRITFINYLGPINFQKKDILFLVKKGKKHLLNVYEDLYKLRIGVKRATAYFDKFNNDSKITKVESVDDSNMARMFVANRFDVMVILDKNAIEEALKKISYSDFEYTKYKYEQKIGNYYGMSKKSPNKTIYLLLNKQLKKMVSTGQIKRIYEAHNLHPKD